MLSSCTPLRVLAALLLRTWWHRFLEQYRALVLMTWKGESLAQLWILSLLMSIIHSDLDTRGSGSSQPRASGKEQVFLEDDEEEDTEATGLRCRVWDGGQPIELCRCPGSKPSRRLANSVSHVCLQEAVTSQVSGPSPRLIHP